MAETSTTRLSLTKPTPGTGEVIDIADHLNGNWDKIDGAIGALPVTAATRPATPYHGQLIRETDTRRLFVWNATQATWDQLMSANGQFAVAGTGSQATIRLYTTSAAALNRAIATRGSGDTQDRYIVDYDGTMQWGAGGASAADTNLYRGAANQLKTDDALNVTGSGGYMRTGASAFVLTQMEDARSTALLDITDVYADVPGTSITLSTVAPGARYLALWSVYYSQVTANSNLAQTVVNVDGVNLSGPAANFTGVDLNTRVSASAFGWATLPTIGSHTFKLRAGLTSGTGGIRANVGTMLTVLIFE